MLKLVQIMLRPYSSTTEDRKTVILNNYSKLNLFRSDGMVQHHEGSVMMWA